MKLLSTALLGTAALALTATVDAAYNATNPALVIYTYPSLLGATNAAGDTYDFVAAYANYSGLPYDSIVVLRMESADLAQNAANYTGAGLPFPADVVIGMDATTADAAAATGEFYAFNLTTATNRVSYLAGLEALNFAKPFDYGYTAVIYDPVKLPAAEAAFHNQSDFNLQRLITTGLVSNLTVNDPTTDTSGVDFLMWTIAELGDGQNITSAYGSASTMTWQQWWKTAFQSGLQVIRSWDNSFNQFSDPTVPNVGMISSYGFDSAYDVCQNITDSLIPVISTINGTQAGWLTVEVYSIVANTTHRAQALNFSNWFFGDANSAQIPESQWSAPANADIPLPACYYQSNSVFPSNTTTNLNTKLSKQASIGKNYNTWVSQWVQLYNNYSNQANITVITL